MAGNCPPMAVCWPCARSSSGSAWPRAPPPPPAPHPPRGAAGGAERRRGGAERLGGCIDDPRASERVRHGLADILRFRMLMIAAGYEDGNDADSMRHDPLFKLALDHLPDGAALCSQPTISRLENLPGRRALVRVARAGVGAE